LIIEKTKEQQYHVSMKRANVRAIYTYDYTKLIVIVRRQWPRMAMPRVRVTRNA